jgi:hypothetical protein
MGSGRSAFVPAFVFAVAAAPAAADAGDPWYEQGDFRPNRRVAIRIHNPLERARINSPVVIPWRSLPMLHDAQEISITLVDPNGAPRPQPSPRARASEGPHGRVAERNGRSFDYQLDDLDKDGIWDEMFFIADLAPGETKTIYAYLGQNERGWNPHRTHAAIGSYMRHMVPFWESENVGWKLWFPTDADVFAKRKPQLMANRLYMENLDGYAVSYLDPGLGSDIMQVDDSFGGGIGVFDDPANPASVSRPRFTPAGAPESRHNAGPLRDTRYAQEVVFNGPLRSRVRIRTMNWSSGHGAYALEQTYTVHAGQDYAVGEVRFTRFEPAAPGARLAVGIRKRPGEDSFFQQGGIVVTAAPETIRNPDDVERLQPDLKVDFAGSALIVPARFKPRYTFVAERGGNHVLSIEPPHDLRFGYVIAAGWSEGAGPRTAEAFRDYVVRSAEELAHPIALAGAQAEARREAGAR